MIARDPTKAAGREHDLIIIGGGIYGACLALEAASRGLRPLLLERGDFGEATSWNSLRILHGGLRYLQTLDVRRLRDSVNERRWFCRTFPELVRPQECLMPLYGDGLKRPLIFRSALLLNDLLSADRNLGVDSAARIGRGRLLSPTEIVSRFPLVDRRGLRGAGLWYDAVMLSSQRVVIEILHWACSLGATALNYVEATGLVRDDGAISAVQARDTMDGRQYAFASRIVCNCAGPWSPELAARLDQPVSHLFQPSLAFNVLLDSEPPSASAVAVAPRRAGSRSGPVYFLYPAFGGLFAGTVHQPWAGSLENPRPSEEQLERFLADVNSAVPGLNVRLEQVVRVFAGLLPVTDKGTANLAVRPTIWDHGRHGGLHGLVSISGVKFTTARLVAEKTLLTMRRYFAKLEVREPLGQARRAQLIDYDHLGRRVLGPDEVRALKRIVQEEAVMTIDDLLFRRLNWAVTERDLGALTRRIGQAIGWAGESARPGTHQARIDAAPRGAEKVTVL